MIYVPDETRTKARETKEAHSYYSIRSGQGHGDRRCRFGITCHTCTQVIPGKRIFVPAQRVRGIKTSMNYTGVAMTLLVALVLADQYAL